MKFFPANPLLVVRPRSLRHGFTLIEMLIVIAIIAILSVSVLNLVDGTVKSERELQLRNDLQTEISTVFFGLARDVAVAEGCVLVRDAESTATQVLALRLAPPPSGATTIGNTQWIVYAREADRITRTVIPGGQSTGEEEDPPEILTTWSSQPQSQCLITHLLGFDVRLEDGSLLRIDLRSEATLFNKTFTVEGSTSFVLPSAGSVKEIQARSREEPS